MVNGRKPDRPFDMNEDQSRTIGDLIKEGAELLAGGGVPEARREASSLLEQTIARDRTFVIAHPEFTLSAKEIERFLEATKRRAAGEPLQYIRGRQEFYGLEFELTPDVLIPRPETELLVDIALELLDGPHERAVICDVGTGSGCVAISILNERPAVRCVALDISMGALEVARRNAIRIGVGERLDLVASDCLGAIAPQARLRIIVSNPPYIAETTLVSLQREVREHEPRVALTPGEDGLTFIRRLVADSASVLQRGNYLLMEIGFDQHEAIRELVDPAVWKLLDIRKDLQGIPRVVVLSKR